MGWSSIIRCRGVDGRQTYLQVGEDVGRREDRVADRSGLRQDTTRTEVATVTRLLRKHVGAEASQQLISQAQPLRLGETGLRAAGPKGER